MRLFFILLLVLCCLHAQARVLEVGAGKALAVPSQAAAQAQDGDEIRIAAGEYKGDVAVWQANNLIIRGVGGRVRLDAAGKSAEGKAIWVVSGKNTTIERIDFLNCRVPDKNGAGIRLQGPGLTVRDCFFFNNEDGILTGANPESDVLLEYCEFSNSGAGDGFSHNIYIGNVRSFTMQFCYSHHANIGHLVKSRAQTNYLLYNRLTDEADGHSSYVVDIPNGGKTVLLGNIIQHGPEAENGAAVSYAQEVTKNAVQELYVVHNTFVNQRQPGRFFRVGGQPVVKIINNLFTGTPTILEGNAELIGNVFTDTPGFVDATQYDYNLTDKSPALDVARDPGKAGDFSLLPTFQYVHPCGKIYRRAIEKLDAGAYQILMDQGCLGLPPGLL